MTPTTTGRAPVLPPQVSYRQGYSRFLEVMNQLHEAGFQRLRVDTYTHPDLAWTIRHHYCHGEWEFYYEPDRYWHPHGSEGSLVRIRLDRPPLPTVEQILSELLGSHVGRIWPAKGAKK